jgi:NADH dehydrogenase
LAALRIADKEKNIMAVLITGGRGFLGSCAVRKMAQQGRGVILLPLDITDETAMKNWLPPHGESISAILHMAAKTTGAEEDIKSVNVRGTQNVLDLGKRFGVAKIVFISSVRALSSVGAPYNVSKREAERLVEESGIPYVILRPSIIYGPNDKGYVGKLIKMIKWLHIVPVLNFQFQPIFVQDVADCAVAALDVEGPAIVNIAGTDKMKFSHFLDLLRQNGLPFIKLNCPRFFSTVLSSLARWGIISQDRLNNIFSGETVDGGEWQDIFHIQATPLAKGIEITLGK